MKNMVTLLFLSLFLIQSVSFSQDTIFLKSGDKVIGKISGISDEGVILSIPMEGKTETITIMEHRIKRISGVTYSANYDQPAIKTTPVAPASPTAISPVGAAGKQLVTYSYNWYTGSVLMMLGGLITAGGALSDAKTTRSDGTQVDDDSKQIFIVSGGVISLVGFIFMMESTSHIAKAGRLLQKSSNVTLIPDRQFPGLGLCYRF